MRSQFHLARRDRRAHGNVAILPSFLLFLTLASPLHAQVGNQNPAGASGIFNGQVTTGCSYDPYTGDATRSITDIAVAGAVGEYSLALVRTANSRAPSTTEVFGWAGGWNHNYNWILEDSPTSNSANFHPTRYTVDFPDGRVETFRAATWDTNYRVRPGADTPAQGTSAGVRERFVPLNLSTMLAYLILPDGGKVEFTAYQHTTPGGRYYYKYFATAIIDPYGLRTTLQWEVVGPTHLPRLVWVIEPAGRYLHFFYVTANGPKISYVTASDGRTVNYYYAYCNGCRLDRIRYYNNAAWDAHYQYCNSNVGQGLPPLLWTADDPMYPGPMKRIAYDYKPLTPNNPDGTESVYGQILRERYWDGVSGHEASGAIVSTLTVGSTNPVNHNTRTETRGDGATRTFVYDGTGHVTWVSDFMGQQSTQGYDAYKYVNSVIDFNRNEINYSCDPITGNVTQIKYPLTQSDTPNQNTRPTVNYTYTNSYYLNTMQGEGGAIQTTTVARDGNNRVSSIVYPDGGWESFTYSDYGKVLTHRMTTGGTESFTYNWPGSLMDTYRNPDNPTGNPTIQYFYDGLGRVNGIFDALQHPTNWTYNDHGQVLVTTLAADPVDNQRHAITNAYNPDGTLQSKTDQLGHMTSYAYDDYRRLTSVTPPVRGFGNGSPHTTNYYYSDPGRRDNYADTNAQASWVGLPSGKLLRTIYDANWRKSAVTVGAGTADSGTTSYTYDGAGNVTWVTDPLGHWINTIYDERNRPSSISHMGQTTTLTYDTWGRKKTITRPNGQVITNFTFDEMNRVLQQNVTQTPDPTAVTKYTYYRSGEGPVGLLHTMQDPCLVATDSTEKYEYTYDLMGRKAWVFYPKDSYNQNRSEHFIYAAAGRLYQFKNRGGNVQTFTYDALNRTIRSDWNDSTPDVTFAYDAASRLTSINNANATIARRYYNDNLLYDEIETITGAVARQVSYTYDADGNRSTLSFPGYQFGYTYTGRNQLKSVNTWADYEYYANGNLMTRTLNNGTHTDYAYDTMDRVTWVTHSFGRWFNYGYYDNSNNRKFTRRWNGQNDNGEVFSYDLADQTSGVQLNIATPQNAPPPSRSIIYDSNGNYQWFSPYASQHYADANNLNQYPSRTIGNTTTIAAYDFSGNLTNGLDAPNTSAYTYDAQNRLTHAAKGITTMDFKYDGLNRQVRRTVGGTTTYNIWDGWDLVEEFQGTGGGQVVGVYMYGAGGLVAAINNGNLNYYYQDGSGSTSHIADNSGHLQEWYRYDLQGAPIIYDANNNQLSTTNRSVRHLFTGQQWYSETGLYDLRNRFYSPDIGRFLQPDGIGFSGDPTNLYRYAGNNPVIGSDPMGLDAVPHSGGYFTYVAYWPWNRLVGSHIVNGSEWLQCAGAARYLGGGYLNGVYYNMPIPRFWYQGAMLSTATAPGTIVATGWGSDGRYPNMRIDQYSAGQTVNHTLVFAYWDKGGNAHLYSQNPGGPIHEQVVNEDDAWQYNEVYVDKSKGPYENTPSTRSVANGNGASGNTGLNTRVPSIIGGIYYPFGFGNMSPNLNFAGGRAGTMQGAFTWGQIGDGSTPNGQIIGLGPDMPMVMEPGIGPGSCFVAGTPVLTADGSEKPIESIEVGELVLAWNEETKQIFSTKVAKTLHHEEKLQTLFDIELEDGRKFTVNNDHPIYVVEDGHFTFSDELAARFAKGEPITFQDNKNQPVKVAGLRMRREKCKMYNLHVEGQGKNGHTYYASGILVHNIGSGYKWK
jgi:RHS repeat-associated protein